MSEGLYNSLLFKLFAFHHRILLSGLKITAEKNRKAGDEFMQALLKKNTKIKTTTSGLSYEILSEGDVNVKATEADTVEILYTGKTIDGKVFDESKEKAIAFREKHDAQRIELEKEIRRRYDGKILEIDCFSGTVDEICDRIILMIKEKRNV